ncbi:MAG: hypothetical protein JO299_19780, partial [Gammaproteobacteria bacterium]|nr:hypothetical protein [Gammaproteobacteria bacterium]
MLNLLKSLASTSFATQAGIAARIVAKRTNLARISGKRRPDGAARAANMLVSARTGLRLALCRHHRPRERALVARRERPGAHDPSNLLVGVPVEVSLPSSAVRTAITVPRDALVIRQNHPYVLRVTGAGTVEELDVTPGAGIADVVEVSGPLAAGDRLVIRDA